MSSEAATAFVAPSRFDPGIRHALRWDELSEADQKQLLEAGYCPCGSERRWWFDRLWARAGARASADLKKTYADEWAASRSAHYEALTEEAEADWIQEHADQHGALP